MEMMQELQTEARRLREGNDALDDANNFIGHDQKTGPLVDEWKLSKKAAPGRRKSRKSQWRNRNEK